MKSKQKKLNFHFSYHTKKFSIPELITDIICGIRDLFSYFSRPNNLGINLAAELFLACCFHLYIDPRSKYVSIKILSTNNKKIVNPFFTAFNHYFKGDTFLEENAQEINLVEVKIYFSIYIIKNLGKFDFSILTESASHSNIFNTIKLDRLVFNYHNNAQQESKTIVSNIPYPINQLSLLYFKTIIVEQSEDAEFSTIASIPIPVQREEPVKYEPINPIWYNLKHMDIREIPIQLTDENNTILNYTNGNINFSLSFRTNTCPNTE